MSMITYFLLIFLCITLHACNARHLSTHDKKDKKLHFPLKISDDEKKEFHSTPKQLNEGNDKTMKTRLVVDSMKPKNRRSRAMKAKGKATLQTETLASSVSWRVPHKKPSEKNPGFNLDYSPPKTHPPSHN